MEIIRGLAPGQSYTTPEGVTFTVRQRNAGVPDAEGWYLARSTEGEFSVRLPARFNDMTSVAKAEDGAVITVYTLGTTAKDGTRIGVNCFARSDSKFKAGGVTEAVKGLERWSRRFRWQPFSHDDISGVEFRGVYANGVDFAGHAFMAQNHLCEFIAEFASSPWEEIPAMVRTSLYSFRSTANSPTR